MPLATISNSASERSPAHAASCRRCARDDTTNKNRCNCRYAPAVSSRHLFAREKLDCAILRHHAKLASRLREDVERFRALCATPDVPARETRSGNPAKTHVDHETRVSENDRALPGQKDRGLNHRSRLPREVWLVSVEKRRTGAAGWENANPLRS